MVCIIWIFEILIVHPNITSDVTVTEKGKNKKKQLVLTSRIFSSNKTTNILLSWLSLKCVLCTCRCEIIKLTICELFKGMVSPMLACASDIINSCLYSSLQHCVFLFFKASAIITDLYFSVAHYHIRVINVSSCIK